MNVSLIARHTAEKPDTVRWSGGVRTIEHIHLVHVLLGEGVRLFDHLGTKPIELERTRVVEARGVTHLSFRIVR